MKSGSMLANGSISMHVGVHQWSTIKSLLNVVSHFVEMPPIVWFVCEVVIQPQHLTTAESDAPQHQQCYGE